MLHRYPTVYIWPHLGHQARAHSSNLQAGRSARQVTSVDDPPVAPFTNMD